jgi:hypothetical protein
MSDFVEQTIREATGAASLRLVETIQSLWSGYGRIARYELTGAAVSTVVVKHVQLAGHGGHPRGWNTDISHQRKLRSYEIETHWYDQWSERCTANCRVPHCHAVKADGDEVLMVFEDLDASGYSARRSAAESADIMVALSWLAHFHAVFLGEAPDGLWQQGTYWHLATRPDELAVLDDAALKAAAPAIDERLRNCRFRTIVHGDAKLANFCFAHGTGDVAAVDFQYVGGGCGMKDVAYFISSCLYETDCERHESALLDAYFGFLQTALATSGKAVDFGALEAEWRELYPFAWTDFFRFLQGWSPGHWKIHSYSRRLANEVLAKL